MNREIKFGLIAHVLNNLGKSRWYYGKIVIQKILYFLQESKKVNLGYIFNFYHYGPYSEELARDIQLMELNKLIESTQDPRGIGYAIHLNEDMANEYINDSLDYIKKHKKKIERVLLDFGGFKPASLELYSTIHFVHKDYKSKLNQSEIKNHVVKIVKKMKPRFSPSVISKSYDRLRELRYIN